jgi:hypothetical protein
MTDDELELDPDREAAEPDVTLTEGQGSERSSDPTMAFDPIDPDAARRLFGYRSEIADIFRGRPLVLDRPIVMQIPWAPV